jgi:hypothetical protein
MLNIYFRKWELVQTNYNQNNQDLFDSSLDLWYLFLDKFRRDHHSMQGIRKVVKLRI